MQNQGPFITSVAGLESTGVVSANQGPLGALALGRLNKGLGGCLDRNEGLPTGARALLIVLMFWTPQHQSMSDLCILHKVWE